MTTGRQSLQENFIMTRCLPVLMLFAILTPCLDLHAAQSFNFLRNVRTSLLSNPRFLRYTFGHFDRE